MDQSNETEKRLRESDHEAGDVAGDSKRMLANTKQFLNNLPDSDPESRRYVADLEEKLENDIRHAEARRDREDRQE
jgi:hypothetical protein